MKKPPKDDKPTLDSNNKKPLLYPDDGPDISELINELIERKRYVKRPSKYHLKHRALNYFPTTEVITIDGEGRHSESGPDAFMLLLDQKYPRRPRPQNGAPPQRSSPNPPSPPIYELSLDDEGLTMKLMATALTEKTAAVTMNPGDIPRRDFHRSGNGR